MVSQKVHYDRKRQTLVSGLSRRIMVVQSYRGQSYAWSLRAVLLSCLWFVIYINDLPIVIKRSVVSVVVHFYPWFKFYFPLF